MIVENVSIHSKPQDILNRLLNSRYEKLRFPTKRSLLNKLSVNNIDFNPLEGA